MLTRLSPALTRGSAIADNCIALVVNAKSSNPTPERSATKSVKLFRTRGSPPVSRIAVTPSWRATRATRSISSNVSSSLLGWNVIPSNGMQ